MRLIDADIFIENILSGLYVFCQENKEDIARAIDSELTVEPDLKLFKEWKCSDCEELEKAYNHGYQKALEFKRPQGEWIFDERGYFYCDKCGKYPHDQYATTDFCPNCGADMRGKEE